MADDVTSRHVRLREVSLPLRSPLGTANGEMTERRVVLVALAGEWADGTPARGVGEAAPLPPWTEAYDECLGALRGVRETVDPGEEFVLDDLPAAAHHAVTLSGVDAEARRDGVPLAETLAERALGDDPVESVPVNATVGDGSVEGTVGEAEAAVAEGFDCLKLKAGARDLDADLDRMRAVREAVGDDVTLRADANGAWSRREAERAVDTLARLDFAYVEQPLSVDDYDGLAALRGRGVDIALDESIHRMGEWPDPVWEYADVAVLKPMAQAGVVPTASLARYFDSHGVDTVVTTTVDAAVARTAAVHVASVVPGGADRAHGLATGGMLAADVAVDPAPVTDGRVEVPEGPGVAGDAFDGLV